MTLPEGLKRTFWDELKTYEEDRKMPYRIHLGSFQFWSMADVNIPNITILIDHGYHLNLIIVALQVVYPQIMTKVRFERSPKPSKAEKKALGKSGFVPVATR